MICNKIRKGDLRSTGNFMEHFRKSHKEIVHEVEQYRKYANIDEKREKFRNRRNTVDDLLKKYTKEEVSLKTLFPQEKSLSEI